MNLELILPLFLPIVLTKVFVYCGIGIIATGVMPIVFELVGWGLKAW